MTAQPTLNGLYHFAYPCRHAEETRRFYEDIIGLPLVHCMLVQAVPSTGEKGPYAHLFFRLKNNSYLAFFDLGRGEMPGKAPNVPRWVEHIAFEVDTMDEVKAHKRRLEAAGIEVRRAVDHEFVQSIYFFDSNDLRVEITTRSEAPGFIDKAAAEAHDELAGWQKFKAERQVEA